MLGGQTTTDRPTNEKAYSPSQNCGDTSTIGGARKSNHSDGLRRQLWEKKCHLQHQLQEVDEAINILDNDETVNKVLKVFDVAQR